MSIESIQQKIIEEFSSLSEWEQKYQYLIEKGVSLSKPSEELKQEENRVKGCQSQVWMKAQKTPQEGKEIIVIEAYSDAAIVRGLIALLLEVYNGHSAEEIINAKLDFLVEIGLVQHLSPNRKNGLSAMLKQIHRFAQLG
jgi:cysteine desulfuration protein SufE